MKNIVRYASLLFAAAMLFSSCGEKMEEEKIVLKISLDKTVVQTDGEDFVTLTVSLGDKILTEADGVNFYKKSKTSLAPVTLPEFKFSTTEKGKHVIMAEYGTYMSEETAIHGISVELPETPEDTKPESTAFKARVLVIEFTGTECGFCPAMKTLFKKTLENETVNERVVLVECHTYNNNDPCYLQTGFDESYDARGYPDVRCDLYYKFNNYKASVSELTGLLNDLHDAKKDGAAGLAVNSILDGDQVITRVTVKSAEAGEYRVGAFLLEDGIYGQQTGMTATWQNTHNHVIRYIDAQDYIGHPIGTVEVGKTADYVFVWDLNDIYENGSPSWAQPFVRENLHIAVYVSAKTADDKGRTFWYVNNAVDCPLTGETAYDYL